jgi:DNA-binding GntR family transcriptional regulator
MLTQAGFVEQRHLSGPRVIDFDVKNSIELVEFHSILFRNVLDYIKPSDHEILLAHLEETFSSQKKAFEEHDDELCFELSIQFHIDIISFCGNTYLRNATLLTQRQLEICESRYQQLNGTPLRSIKDHEVILDYLRQSDWDGFVQALIEHNENALCFFRQLDKSF